jgi:xanthine dehydrogenase YagR molybdenum-binding subunit
VNVDYQATPPALSLDAGIARHGARPKDSEHCGRGDPDTAFGEAAVRLDATYTTPVEVHHAMELHSTLARWDGHRLELDDSTQWVVGQAKTLARVLGLPEDKVVVRAPFVGGGFGSKLFLWPHAIRAAVAARQLQRPVKFVLPRAFHFTTTGHRPFTRQRIQIGATRDGRLVALRHDTVSHTSLVTDFVESCGEPTPRLYRCPHVAVTHRLVSVNVGTPNPMRGPGTCPGMFALESALDELALQLDLDPVELRRRNLPSRDEHAGLPWSSCHFEECLRTAAERFGWDRRNPAIGSMRDGREILGWGVASATWPAHRDNATVRIELRADGTARAACATQDIGTGTATVIAQTVAELTRLPLEKIEVSIGDSTLPPGPISGGSMVTATMVPAVAQACRLALKELFLLATQPGAALAGEDWRTLAMTEEGVAAAGRSAPLADVLRSARRECVAGETLAESGDETKKFSFRSFGAHCVEVRWDPGISRLRVSRVVGAFDTGRIINRKMAMNQIEGAIVMGVGMALLEQSIYDERTGRVVNDNLADYHLAVHADAPVMDVTLLDRPDPNIGDFGAKGLGEIGITGIAAAIANAVHHATGKRIRDLPITIEKLLP